jgi:branched-chain amino acid transport system substrate-binding protein
VKHSSTRLRGAVVVCAMALVAASCGGSDDAAVTTEAAPAVTDAPTVEETTAPTEAPAVEETTAPTDAPEETTAPTEAPAPLLVPDNGPCDAAKPTVMVSIQTVIESPVISLKRQVDALTASVDAFNGRGGVGGRCMELMICDDKADPNVATDCARSIVDSESVASLNDTTTTADKAVQEIFTAANYPRVAQSPGTPDFGAPNSYNLGGGGLGTTFEMIPPLLDAGKKKIAAIHVDLPAFQGALPLLKMIIEAGGGELVATIPVPAGTTNFDQFILAAEDAGADGVMLPLGDKESAQVLGAAADLGTELTFSVSLGTFSANAVAELGDLGKQMVFNAEVPPATVTADQFAAMPMIIEDLGVDAGDVASSEIRSWLAVYAFVTVMGATDVDNITRESVTAAFNAATDIDMLGLQKPWTPNKPSPGVFSRISNPNYYFATWDGETFVTSDEPTGDVLATLKPTGLAG